MSHIRTSITTDHRSTSSSHESDSLTDGESSYTSSPDNDGQTWAEDLDDDIEPSDSASASAEYQHPSRPHKAPVRRPSRRHSRSQRQQGFAYRTVPAPQPAMSTDRSDEYPVYQGRGGYTPTPAPYYSHPAQSHVNYAPPYAGGRGQMVHYNSYQQNPFAPLPAAAGASYYGEQPRANPNFDMVPYHGNFFGAGPAYGMTPIPPYMYANAPPPPPTEAPAPSHTPAPPAEKKVDPEVENMRKQLELLQAEKKAKEEEIKQKQMAEQMRLTAEAEFERRMEKARREAEEQKREIEKAKADAERTARERMEAERKAEEEKQKQQKAALERLEAEARMKIERERREEEENKRRAAEMAAAAEAALKAKMEAAEAEARAKAAAEFKAEIEAKEAAERRAKEEAEWRKKLEEEAKLKAELEARAKLEEERKKEVEAKAAEEAKKLADKALREKIIEETKVKIQEDAKKKEKAPIKFKDAVGRKFSFPFHLCNTWQGMEDLIKQAFVQVDVIGPHVQEGHYDLIGPDGEIILPTIWEKVVQPDWSITMHMWPMDKAPLLRSQMHGHGFPPGAVPPGARHHAHAGIPGRGMPMPMRPNPGHPVPPGAAAPGAPRPYWQPMPPGMRPGQVPRGPANVVNGDPPPKHEKKKGHSSKTAGTTFLGFMGGKPSKPSKKRK